MKKIPVHPARAWRAARNTVSTPTALCPLMECGGRGSGSDQRHHFERYPSAAMRAPHKAVPPAWQPLPPHSKKGRIQRSFLVALFHLHPAVPAIFMPTGNFSKCPLASEAGFDVSAGDLGGEELRKRDVLRVRAPCADDSGVRDHGNAGGRVGVRGGAATEESPAELADAAP